MEYQCLEDFTEELKDKISNINEQRKAFFSRSSDDLYSDLVAQKNYLLNDTIYSYLYHFLQNDFIVRTNQFGITKDMVINLDQKKFYQSRNKDHKNIQLVNWIDKLPDSFSYEKFYDIKVLEEFQSFLIKLQDAYKTQLEINRKYFNNSIDDKVKSTSELTRVLNITNTPLSDYRYLGKIDILKNKFSINNLSYIYRYVNNKESIKEDGTYEFIHNNVDILKDNFTMDEFMMWALYERNYLDYIVFGNKENKKYLDEKSGYFMSKLLDWYNNLDSETKNIVFPTFNNYIYNLIDSNKDLSFKMFTQNIQDSINKGISTNKNYFSELNKDIHILLKKYFDCESSFSFDFISLDDVYELIRNIDLDVKIDEQFIFDLLGTVLVSKNISMVQSIVNKEVNSSNKVFKRSNRDGE